MKKEGMAAAGEALGQVSGRTVEAMTAWADANQRLLRELVDFSVGAAKERSRRAVSTASIGYTRIRR
jgi:hypothetical protein